MSRKVLFTANTLRHLYLCHRPYLKYFKDMGYIVHTATDKDTKLDSVDKSYKLSIKRNPYSFKNIKAIFELRKILKKEDYDLIHTHTPMGAVVTRIAAINARKKGTKIIYTAHGFHFFKGASIFNWLLFYPIEKILSNYTDMIMTINKEDYLFAKKHFKTQVKYVAGVGFDEDKFTKKLNKKEQDDFRKSIGLSKDDYVISYVAEISKRKRQEYLLKVISKMDITNEKFLFIGDLTNDRRVRKYIDKYNLWDVVKLVDFNDYVSNYLDISDLAISVSKQEGLPLNIMEAMYKGKPIIVSDCRGNRDLIKNKVNGLVVDLYDEDALIAGIEYLKSDKEMAKKYGHKGMKLVYKYSINTIMEKMKKIYEGLINNDKEK